MNPAAAFTGKTSRVDTGYQLVRDQAPLAFEPNGGQFAPALQFAVRAGDWLLALTGNEMVIGSAGGALRFPLLGIDESTRWVGETRLPGKVNYLIGRDESRWARNLPTYSSIRRGRLYSGIDMVVRGEGRRLEYEFQLAPGADPSLIRLGSGGLAATIDPNGDLLLSTAQGVVRHRHLAAWQIADGKKRVVGVSFDLSAPGEIRFRVGSFDRSLQLVIDPIVSYYLYIGGSSTENLTASATDASSIYLTGSTFSPDFFLAGSPFSQSNSGRTDAFLSKFAFNGNPIYSTYFGGGQDDEATAVAVDGLGFAYLTGTTNSPNLPVAENAIQPTYGGNGDSFAVKMNIEGSGFHYSSYLGGSEYDYGAGVAVDSAGYATFTGGTSSANFPIRNARQSVFGGGEDIWIYKLNANGSTTEFSTYFGGENVDQAQAVALDPQGNAYIAGRASCAGLPAFTIGTGSSTDVILIKWRADGNGAFYVTCVGGNGIDSPSAIVVDGTGNAYVTGYTGSTDFPVVSPMQRNYGGAAGGSIGDAFLLKLNSPGTALIYSTYLGGTRDDIAYSLTLDNTGSIFVGGVSYSPDFPAASSPAPTLGRFGFLLRIAAQSGTLIQSYFLEGIADSRRFLGIVDPANNLYMAGHALANTPISAAPMRPLVAFRGTVQDIFLARFTQARLEVYADTYSPSVQAGSTITLVQRVVNRGPDDAAGASVRGTVPPGLTIVSCTIPTSFCSVSGSAFRVDTAILQAGHGMEITLRLLVSSTLPAGAVQRLSTTAVSDSYDQTIFDNTISTNLFVVGPGTVCNYVVSPPVLVYADSPANATFSVSAPFACSWSAQAANDWITLASSNIATGTSSVSFTVAPNLTSLPRIGSVTVAGQRYAILQRTFTNSPQFTDVTVMNNIFFDYIQLMKAFGVTTGCGGGQYCPDAATSRGQMAVFIIRSMLGGDNFPYPDTPYFADVPGSHPQFKYVQKMRELGITAGCTPTSFCVDDAVTRSQMAVFLIRGRLAVSSGQTYPFPDSFSFNDVAPSSPFYSAIQKMKELGITSGCSAITYCPDDSTTRGQMAVFLMRTFFTP